MKQKTLAGYFSKPSQPASLASNSASSSKGPGSKNQAQKATTSKPKETPKETVQAQSSASQSSAPATSQPSGSSDPIDVDMLAGDEEERVESQVSHIQYAESGVLFNA